ncbi:MAG: ATP-binding protein, partial [Pirellulales bacterium]|nr:ATP-binding protein [Pirellulales bacterium]
MENRNLPIILDAIPEPIMLVNTRRQIVHANEAAQTLFGPDITGRDLVRAIRHPGALECVDKVLAGSAHEEAVVVLPVPVRTTYQAQAARLAGDDETGPRAVFSLHDMSHIVEAEQMRVEFVANVSHELRSPLTALSGFIETLKGSAKNDAKARARFLDIMWDEAERMKRLIDDLLSLSSVEVKEHVRPDGSVNIRACAARVIELVGQEASSQDISINLSAPPDLEPIPGDNDELTEVLQNLVENSLKYAHSGSEVDVSISRVDSAPGILVPAISIAVSDQSDGIAEEHIPRLTERFYRVDKSRSRERGGTGLGLAIVKHIINRHRGRLQIESE